MIQRLILSVTILEDILVVILKIIFFILLSKFKMTTDLNLLVENINENTCYVTFKMFRVFKKNTITV